MVDIAVISCPRKLPTLGVSIQSLRDAGVNWHIWVFSEPGEVTLKGNNITIGINNSKLGAFANYNKALQFITRKGTSKFKCVLQDDYIYSKNLFDKLTEIEQYEGDFGYFNLFSNGYHPTVHDWLPADGWNRTNLGADEVWGAAFVFQADKVPVITGHEFYKKIMSERNEMIDGTISEVCKRLELPMFHHNPSLVYSIGYTSTLGHKYRTDGYKFKG